MLFSFFFSFPALRCLLLSHPLQHIYYHNTADLHIPNLSRLWYATPPSSPPALPHSPPNLPMYTSPVRRKGMTCQKHPVLPYTNFISKYEAHPFAQIFQFSLFFAQSLYSPAVFCFAPTVRFIHFAQPGSVFLELLVSCFILHLRFTFTVQTKYSTRLRSPAKPLSILRLRALLSSLGTKENNCLVLLRNIILLFS